MVSPSQPARRPDADAVDPPDFASIYEAEVDYVWRSLRRLGARPEEVEDLVHEVFLVLHRRLADYDTSRPIRPWLFGIAYRIACKARGRAAPVAPLVEEPADPAPGADEALEAEQARRLLHEALGSLALEERALIAMHDIDGYSARQIGEVLGVPSNTVWSRLRAARARLATALRRVRLRRGEE